eukprot:GHVS01012341.1.p1 GENE.GHVS01012341.1~~GHVS01012341.1.p1  ORF type:complete len:123 (+),score=0.68 GHVS01012341.1:1282-1650(+)
MIGRRTWTLSSLSVSRAGSTVIASKVIGRGNQLRCFPRPKVELLDEEGPPEDLAILGGLQGYQPLRRILDPLMRGQFLGSKFQQLFHFSGLLLQRQRPFQLPMRRSRSPRSSKFQEVAVLAE